jgi:HlyD family secretion protein
MGVDLNDLRIRRDETSISRAGRLVRGVAVILAIAALCAAAYFLLRNAGRGEEGIEVDVVSVSVTTGPGPAPRSFTAGGWVEPAFPWPVMVSALAAGRVDRLAVQEGDRVAPGQVIAELYAVDFRDEIRRAEAELELGKAELRLLEAGFRKEEIGESRARLRELEADRDLKKKVSDRSRSLSEFEAVSREQAERDEAAFLASQARVDAQKERLALLEKGTRPEEIEAARAEVIRLEAVLVLARRKLEYASVRAPRAGTVYRLLSEQGQRLAADSPFVLSLYDPASLWVRVDVAQADIGKVRQGQSAEVRTEAEPGRFFPGKVVRIDPRADFAKNTITVRVELSDTEGRLHPDMTARVHFHAEGAPAGEGESRSEIRRLMIPRIAVVRSEAGAFVFEYAAGKARRRDVELGGTLGDAVEVVSGLSASARVIVSGLDQVSDGSKVHERKGTQ